MTAAFTTKARVQLRNALPNSISYQVLYLPNFAQMKSVTRGAQVLPFQFQPHPEWGIAELSISLGEVAPSEIVEVELEYGGAVECEVVSLLDIRTCIVSEDYTIFTGVTVLPLFENEPAIDLTLTYPGSLEATAGGSLVSEQTLPDGKKQKKLHDDHFSSSLFLVLGAFDVQRKSYADYQVASFTRALDGPYREAYQDVIHRILDDYSQRYSAFGFDKLEYVGTPDDLGFGGMAGNGVLFMADYNFTMDPAQTPGIASTFAHEIGHQWFAYKLRASDWMGPWLSEGFTEYLAGVWTGREYTRFYGRPLDSTYFRYYNEAFTSYVPVERDEALTGPAYQDPNLDMMLYVMLAYYKGPLVANVIAQQLGGWEAFEAAVKKVAQAHAFEPYDTETFKGWLEEASGVSLTEVFDAWVYGKGYPTYQVYVHDGTGAQGGESKIIVKRDRIMPGVTELGVSAGDEQLKVPVQFAEGATTATVRVTTTKPLASVKLDPDYKQLRKVQHLPEADLNGNGEVDGIDVLAIAWAQGSRFDDQRQDSHWYSASDANGDGAVDEADLQLALDKFGAANP
ncbi:MAG: M1 family aminopeptidase [Myxococcales bacterium]